MNSFKAKVTKWAGASSADVCKLVEWLHLSKSPVQLENPNLQFATVTNQSNEIVGCVPFERVFVVNADAVAYKTTPSNSLPAGNTAAGAIELAAQEQGVGKVLMVLSPHHPPSPGEKWIRVVEQPVNAHPKPFPEVTCHTDSPSRFLN